MDLVTGGTGIVGVHILNELLDRGRNVRALHRPDSDRELVRRVLCHYHADGAERFNVIEWVEGDLLEPDALCAAMKGVERVFHCAALVSFDPRDTERMFLHNITGTANVVNAMLASGVQRLGHISSTATIGFRPDGGANDETVEFKSDKSASAYAISKYEAELEVQRGIAEGLFAVMVNPCVVIGPGPAGRSSMTIMERMRKGSRFFPQGSNAVVDARDVATAIVRLVDEGPIPGQSMGNGERHLLIGENISYRDLFSTIARNAGKEVPTTPIAPSMLEFAWRFERLRTLFGGRPLVTKASARTASRQRLYDGSKARKVLSMEFRKAEEAVANTERFLRAQ